MNSLVKVPSYSKLNFQGKMFFELGRLPIDCFTKTQSLLYEDRILANDTLLILQECYSLSKFLHEKGTYSWLSCQSCCRFLVVGNIFRLETCMNSLVKVPSYSKLNFQGKMFFTQNWCNIILSKILVCIQFFLAFVSIM
jgi:hypothetical protein